jgi:hypothetical protein
MWTRAIILLDETAQLLFPLINEPPRLLCIHDIF